MLTINLDQFTQFSNTDLYKFLLSQNQTFYQIIIPKSGYKGEFQHLSILTDYYFSTYTGELLHNLSTNFSYFTPSPLSADPFYFKFTCTNPDALADLLYFLAHGLQLDPANLCNPLYDKMLEESHDFITKALEEDDFTPACYGLFQIAIECLNKQ